MMYDVSIIVPIYNAEKYLQKCIESLINQDTLLKYCIILVNDGSTDSSLSICKKYGNKYENIIVLDKTNGGTSSAKNMGLDFMNSNYVMFVDSDDYVNSNYISNMFDSENCVYDLVVCGYTIKYTKNEYSIDNLPDNSFSHEGKIDLLLTSLKSEGLLNVDVSKLYRTDILNKYEIRFNENFATGEDLIFNCKYLQKINSFKTVSNSSYIYVRRDQESLVNSYKNNLKIIVNECLLNVKALYKPYLNSHNITYLSNIMLDYRNVEIINLYRKNCRLSKSEKINYIKYVLNNNDLKNYSYTSDRKDFISRIFYICVKYNLPLILYYLYNILFFLKNRLKKLYLFVRERILFK